MRYELRPHRVCPMDRASTPQGVSQMRGPLWWKPLREELLLLEYLAMAFAQLTYRESLRDIETRLGAVGGKLYQHGFPHQRGAVDASRRQRIARLAHLCQLCADTHCGRAPAVCWRYHGRRSGSEPVCSGFDNHRSVSGVVSLGPIPAAQGGTRCWTCVAIFRRSFTSPTARCTT